ncbi:MAG: hypothetical protein E6G41_10195 [Actinobacteria bacterium]|nr:MAG: hypothetical protein E6G41_10195 [Actinomycetota bacterium]
MRRAILLLLLLPATATAAPARAPESEPSLVGTPYLFRSADDSVRLVFRTDTPLDRRYDGLIGGGAIIAGHTASIGTIGECYTAAVRFASRLGRRYRVIIATQQGEPAPFDLRLRLRRARPGDSRGLPLGC